MKISIVIPILNEREILSQSVARVRRLQDHSLVESLVFSDSESVDGSVEYLQNQGFQVLKKSYFGRPSIAKTVQQSVKYLRSAHIMILPIDTELTSAHLDALAERFHQRAGLASTFFTFRKKYDQSNWVLSSLQLVLRYIREGFLHSFVWTNVFVVRREDLSLLPSEGFLDDVVFSDRLKKFRRSCQLKIEVTVSARKYQKDGPIRRVLLNAWILFSFRVLRRNPSDLAAYYNSTQGGLNALEKFFHHKGRRQLSGSDPS